MLKLWLGRSGHFIPDAHDGLAAGVEFSGESGNAHPCREILAHFLFLFFAQGGGAAEGLSF